MTNEELKTKITGLVPEAEIADGHQFLTVNVPPAKLNGLCKALKEGADTAFDYLYCLTGMDYGDSLGVVYHLESTKLSHKIVVKTKTSDRPTPVIPTICDIWVTAEFHEREVYDLLGIVFSGHPDMRRIFLEETWIGYPLRKDYVDEVNIIER